MWYQEPVMACQYRIHPPVPALIVGDGRSRERKMSHRHTHRFVTPQARDTQPMPLSPSFVNIPSISHNYVALNLLHNILNLPYIYFYIIISIFHKFLILHFFLCTLLKICSYICLHITDRSVIIILY